MKNFILTFIGLTLTISVNAQNLDKLRVLCIDDVNLPQYKGNLSTDQLKEQIAALGFTYIEQGDIKYHDELIVYDCNTGNVQFTAVFDENRLVKEFVQYQNKDVVEKKLQFSKTNKSPYVDLSLQYRGQEIPAYPVGTAELFEGSKLIQKINFNENDMLPTVINYSASGNKVSEGTATISGKILGDWNIAKRGQWKNYENGVLASILEFGPNSTITSKKLYNKGDITEEITFSANGVKTITSFYPEGDVKEKGSKSGDSKIGLWKLFKPSGQLAQEITYEGGEVVEEKTYNNEGALVQQKSLVSSSNKLPKSIDGSSIVYEQKTYHANGNMKSTGFLVQDKRVGIHENFNKSGELVKIIEYNKSGKEINSLDAATYESIKEKEKAISNELLVAETTHPLNVNIIENIKTLTESLDLDYDSLTFGYDYEKEYFDNYSAIKSKTKQFGQLGNNLEWYQQLQDSAENFTNEVWSYSHDLVEMELFLEKELAKIEIAKKLDWLKDQHTSSKNTLFGTKLVVENDQEAIYEFIVEEVYPSLQVEIENAQDPFELSKNVEDFYILIGKASNMIKKPEQDFDERLENTDSLNDKKSLFLTAND